MVVTPSPRPTSSALPPKSTTLYVGKIAPTVDDSVIRALLEACGPMKSWKRVQDPETQQPKGFGFCEYEEADGVLKALQLLNKLSLDGQELLLKWNTATEKYIEELQARKARDAAAAKARGETGKAAGGTADGGAAGEDGAAEEGEDAEASKENAILEKIMAIVSEQASKASAQKAADQFLSNMRDERGRSRRDDDRRARPSRDGGERAAERQMEAEFAREKERERSRMAERNQELQRAYDERERAWLKHERCAIPSGDLLGCERLLVPHTGHSRFHAATPWSHEPQIPPLPACGCVTASPAPLTQNCGLSTDAGCLPRTWSCFLSAPSVVSCEPLTVYGTAGSTADFSPCHACLQRRCPPICPFHCDGFLPAKYCSEVGTFLMSARAN